MDFNVARKFKVHWMIVCQTKKIALSAAEYNSTSSCLVYSFGSVLSLDTQYTAITWWRRLLCLPPYLLLFYVGASGWYTSQRSWTSCCIYHVFSSLLSLKTLSLFKNRCTARAPAPLLLMCIPFSAASILNASQPSLIAWCSFILSLSTTHASHNWMQGVGFLALCAQCIFGCVCVGALHGLRVLLLASCLLQRVLNKQYRHPNHANRWSNYQKITHEIYFC